MNTESTNAYEEYHRNTEALESLTSEYQQLNSPGLSRNRGTITSTQLNVNDGSAAYEVVGAFTPKADK